MKKTALCLLMAIGFPSTYAATDFYAGAGVGLDQLTTKRTVGLISSGPGFYEIHTTAQRDVDSGAMGNLFLGLRYYTTQYSLSGEIDGQLSNARITATDSDYLYFAGPTGMKIQTNGTLRLSILPAVNLTETTSVFARLGYARTRFTFSSTGVSGGDFIPTGSYKQTLSAYVVGAGMETALTDQVRVRAEYNYSNYQAIDLPTTTNSTNHQVAAHIRPVDHLVALSFIVRIPV